MMRPGTYYVGDLCYVMHPQWKEVCDLIFATEGNNVLDGEFNLPNGVRFATHGTAYGDGVYKGSDAKEYPVDSGSIGCIRVEDVYDPEWYLEGMHIHEFNHPFELEYYEGEIRFVEHLPNGEFKTVVNIDTSPWEEDDEPDYDEEDA